jgi:AsnC-like ligand binding domain
MTQRTIPIQIDDPINARILAVSEDKVQGYLRDPLGEIAQRSGVDLATVVERLRAMLEAGTIRRVRQTLMATNLAPGALVAWRVPPDKLNSAFDYMSGEDPFSGHVVIRSTDGDTPGSQYRLWTTLKVPVGYSMDKHCAFLMSRTGTEGYKLLPAKKLFALGVGHVRRKDLEPGARTDEPGRSLDVSVVRLNDLQWRVLMALKRDFSPGELGRGIWVGRAAEAGVSLDEFHRVAEDLNGRRVIGRFSTFLEHVKKLKDGSTVTKYNALFHWAVPPGREMDAGLEVGRHHIMTHAYWREAGEEFNHVNIMGVAHGTDKKKVLAHKAAMDRHLAEAGIEVSYTNVFWGGRSEIKPSEISPAAYKQWCVAVGLDPESMRG